MLRTCVAVLLACVTLPAQVQTWIYDFETPGLLPHDATARISWESQNGPPTMGTPLPMASVANGFLLQRLTQASCGFAGGRGMFYAGDRASAADAHVTPSIVNSAWDSVIEARVRFTSFETGTAAAILLMEDQFGRYGIWFSQGSIRILGPNTSISYTVVDPAFNVAQFHDYRIESDGGSLAMRVFIDGVNVWAGIAPSTTTRNTVMWGDGSSGTTNDVDADWDWVRAYNGPGLFSSSPQWQVNQPGAALSANNATSDVYAPLRAAACVNETVTITANSSNFGMPWDVGYAVGAPGRAASAGGITVPGGQIVNLDLTAPSLSYLNGFSFTSPFGAALSLPLTSPVPVSTTGQMVVLDPGQAPGFALSALAEITFANGGTVTGLANRDNKSTVVPLMAPPLCSPNPITFAGSTYTQMSVSSNGRVTFGGSNSSPTVATATLSTLPAVAAFWTDLDNRPTPAGVNDISVTQAAGVITLSWSNVPSFGSPFSANSVDVVFDTVAGSTTIQNYAPDPGHSATSMIGLSPGGSANDPGTTPFSTLVGSGGIGASNDMIYDLMLAGPVPGGFNSISFPLSDPTAFFVN